MAETQYMRIRGASEHNLKNIDIGIPKNKLVVLTGLSGSGKSSLAFDTIYADGQRRYMESLSSYARQFMGQMKRPEVVKQGNRKEIAKVVNTLMRKKYKAECNGRKFHKTDNYLLTYVENILFAELAMSFNTTFEEIYEKVMSLIAISENN